MYRSRARSCIACRTAAAKRARRVLFPRTSQPFFSFRTSAGSFLLASLFFCGKRKGEIQDSWSVHPYWPGRYCRLFPFDINSGYILDTASRTVSPRTAMRGPGKRILRVNLPVFPGCRVENSITPHSDAGSREVNLTSKLAGILWIPRRSAG